MGADEADAIDAADAVITETALDLEPLLHERSHVMRIIQLGWYCSRRYLRRMSTGRRTCFHDVRTCCGYWMLRGWQGQQTCDAMRQPSPSPPAARLQSTHIQHRYKTHISIITIFNHSNNEIVTKWQLEIRSVERGICPIATSTMTMLLL